MRGRAREREREWKKKVGDKHFSKEVDLKGVPMSDSSPNTSLPNTTSSSSMIRLQYEIFGKVQGVFFRKFTKEKADSLGIVGYVLNTKQNTVKGEAQGSNESIQQLK